LKIWQCLNCGPFLLVHDVLVVVQQHRR